MRKGSMSKKCVKKIYKTYRNNNNNNNNNKHKNIL